MVHAEYSPDLMQMYANVSFVISYISCCHVKFGIYIYISHLGYR